MTRATNDLPRMQNQSKARAPLGRSLNIVSQVIEKANKQASQSKPPILRQYDLVERVRRYNPGTSEALLNRAYVYAMRAHGEQKRAQRRPKCRLVQVFSAPIAHATSVTPIQLNSIAEQ